MKGTEACSGAGVGPDTGNRRERGERVGGASGMVRETEWKMKSTDVLWKRVAL